MKKVISFSRVLLSAMMVNIGATTFVQAHPLTELHVHTSAGVLAIALTAVVCIGFICMRFKRNAH